MLYLIKSDKYMKIGYTNNLKSRKYIKADNTEWGLWNDKLAQEFYDQAYLTDVFYFDCDEEILNQALLDEDPLGKYVMDYPDDDNKLWQTKLAIQSGKIPRVKIINDRVVYIPTISNSNILYIRDIISKLKYKPRLKLESNLNSDSSFAPKINPNYIKTGLPWIIEYLQKSSKLEYTYQELEEIFKPLFKEHNLKWNKNTSINTFFPECKKQRKKIKGERYTIYNFNI